MLVSLSDEQGYGAVSGALRRLPKPACLLGKGGFAVVLRHWDTGAGAPVAVKRACMGPWKFGLLCTSVRECGVLAELGCLPVAAAAHFATCAAPPFVLKGRVHMPLLDADTDLASVLQRLRGNGSGALAGVPGCPPLAALASALHPGSVVPWLFSSVLVALGALHAAGWVHRDLKPENLLLCPRDSASSGLRLCDFGTATRVPSASSACSAADVASVAAEHQQREQQRQQRQQQLAEGGGASRSSKKRARSSSEGRGEEEEEEGQEGSDSPYFDQPSRWDGHVYGHVSTLPFRAPELVMGAHSHAGEVDSWGAGVSLAEVLRCALQLELAAAGTAASSATAGTPAGLGFAVAPLFAQPFDGELSLLAGIGRVLGPACARVWPEGRRLSGYMSFATPCKYCGSGEEGGQAEGGAAAPRPAPPAWCLPETLASSCLASHSTATPLFHLHAAESLWDYLVGSGKLNAYDTPVASSSSSSSSSAAAAAATSVGAQPAPVPAPPRPLLAAQVDLLVRLLAWDPSRRLLPQDALGHPALSPAAPGQSPQGMLRTLCRALQPPPKVEGALRGAEEEEEGADEWGEDADRAAMPVFARGALLFGAFEGDE